MNADKEGGMGGVDQRGISTWKVFHTDNGGMFRYNLTATDTNMIAFTDGNIRSMAEGGPFANWPELTDPHAGNMTGDTIMPGGFCCVVFLGQAPEGSPQSMFTWKLTRY
jgi:hypothetical protein